MLAFLRYLSFQSLLLDTPLEQKFIELIQNNQGIIHKICRLYCEEEEDRRDLFQEITLQLWRSFPSFRAEAKITTWMYRIALNTAIARLRKSKRQISDTPLSEQTLQIAEDTSDKEREERLAMLYAAIRTLSKVERAIIMLYLEDKSYDEIAEIIGISKTNVGVKINRIKKKLKTSVEQQQD